ncbi:hypothetical protein KCU81_g5031, partial [Aureobasidium melanogenum]|uniref:Uncharacterized protein n=1 Tax=Aureobasidium melanogenum (strain CBS 110374) TaxID=1043003 RepID=A0A074W923_AURM1
METLTAPPRSDLSIPVPGAGKHFEMHPSGPSVNPATRMPPPPSNNQDSQDRSHIREQDRQSTQSEDSNSTSKLATVERSHTILPTVPYEHDQNDASQSSSRVRTPEDASQSQTDSIYSPTRHKRTASGLFKAVDTPNEQRPRAESVSSAGSKAGEVAAQLKTRLAYAMVKVQHGWEHRNINEVERLAAAMHPRMAASPTASTAPIDIRSPPSKRRSGAGVVTWSLPDSSPAMNGHSQNAHMFRRPSVSSPPAQVLQVPSTPKSRPPPVRSTMPTQQAEQDAMDALMLMGGSPGNGGKFPASQSSSSQQTLHSQSQQNWQCQGSVTAPSRHYPDSPTAADKSPMRPIILSRNNSSTSEVSIANSEVREARERVLEEVEEAA